MCGIVGLFSFSNHGNKYCTKDNLINSLNQIQYRGPDELSGVLDKNFYLGTARLAIEAVKYGRQPFFSSDKKLAMVFNGEIFNYKDLIQQYFKNKNIKSEGDLIINLFQKFGSDFVQKIKGQFAISIFDRNEQTMYLFRDRYGIRPLYYYVKKSQMILFASEIKSLVKVLGEKPDISTESLASTATFWTNIGNETSFKNYFKVLPGHYLIIKKKSLIKVRYHLNDFYSCSKKNFKSTSELREYFIQAIKNQLQSEIGYGAYLSGGIDSSALAFELSNLKSKKLDTFSIKFENKEYDESEKQETMAKFLKSNHNSLYIKNVQIYENFFKAVNHAETLFFRTAPVPMLLLSKLVKKNGHKVVFSGEGADETMLGYDIFSEMRIRKFWSKEKNSKRRNLLFAKLYGYLPQFRNKKYLPLTTGFYRNYLDFKDNDFFSHEIRWSQYDQIKSFFKGLNKRSLNANLKKIKKELPKNYYDLEPIRKAQILEFETLLSNYLLCTQGDKMSMANSVESRVPFLDEDFINNLKNYNDLQFQYGIKNKYFFRKAYSGILPNKIVNAPKIAYQAPEAKVFFSKGKPRDLTASFLNYIEKNNIFNYNNFNNLVTKIKNSEDNYRMSFRDNFAFILGVSYYCLDIASKEWSKKIKMNMNNKVNIINLS